MSILIINQSVIDMCASFFTILLAVEKKWTGMSRDSIYDQFVCRFWLTHKPLWCMLVTSTYGILLITLSRYIAVIYPMKYKEVRIVTTYSLLFCECALWNWLVKIFQRKKTGTTMHVLNANFYATGKQ